MIDWIWRFWLLFAFLLPATVRAEDRAAARSHYSAATQHYDLGEFKEALTEFKEAYRNYEEPSFLFNIAQCMRQLGNKQDAILFYRTYLRKVPNAPNRSDVEGLVSRLENEVATERATKAVPPEGTLSPQPPQPAGTENKPAATPVPVETAPTSRGTSAASPPTTQPPVTSNHSGRAFERGGIAVAVVGGALLVTGIGLGAAAHSDANALTSLDQTGGVYDAAKASQGQTLNASGIALVTVGAVAAITGTVLAIVGARKQSRARETASVSLLPVLHF